MNSKKVELLNYQLILSVLFIITLIISIILTYDEKQEIQKNQRLFNETFDKYLNLFNRILSLLIIIGIFYINYKDYEINKYVKKNLKPFEHQIIASIFSIISAIIVLYVVIENWYQNPNISSIQNPTV